MHARDTLAAVCSMTVYNVQSSHWVNKSTTCVGTHEPCFIFVRLRVLSLPRVIDQAIKLSSFFRTKVSLIFDFKFDRNASLACMYVDYMYVYVHVCVCECLYICIRINSRTQHLVVKPPEKLFRKS